MEYTTGWREPRGFEKTHNLGAGCPGKPQGSPSHSLILHDSELTEQILVRILDRITKSEITEQ